MTPSAGLWFVDSNVLLYSLGLKNTAKQRSARLWLDTFWEHRCGCLSIVRKAVEAYIEWGPAESSMGA